MATLYARKKTWWIGYTVDGKRVLKSTKIPLRDRHTAKLYKADLEARLLQGHLGIASRQPLMDASRRFLKTIEATRSPNTFTRYRECLQHFLAFWGKKFPSCRTLDTITTGRVQDWITDLSSRRKPNTVHIEFQTLTRFLNYCVRQGWLPKNPVPSFTISKPRKITAREPLYFSPEQMRTIFARCPPNRRDLYKFLYYTGARIGETAALKVSAIGQDYIQFLAGTTKGKRTDTVPIADKLRPVLAELTAGKKPDDLLFPDAPTWGVEFNTIRLELKSMLKELGLPEGAFHTFRHTAGSHWAQAGVPITVVQQLLRHKNIRETMIYAHLAPTDTKKYVNFLPV